MFFHDFQFVIDELISISLTLLSVSNFSQFEKYLFYLQILPGKVGV